MSLAEVATALQAQFGIHIDTATARSAAGGSINAAWRVESDQGPVFLKTNRRAAAPMFSAEVDGLAALEDSGCVTVPRPLCHGETASVAFLLLECIDLDGGKTKPAARRLGRDLARLHRQEQRDFGWRADNFIGSTPQPNTRDEDWSRFFGKHRLHYQLQLASANGYSEVTRRGADVLAALPRLLADHQPAPSLLHGDLWGGNWGASADGTPWLFDPAVYCGDREADLAMTRLFGGFPDDFYQAYAAEWPLPSGWQERIELYNLYHVLNHLNLFGSGYLGQARSTIEGLLAAVS